MCFGHRWDDCGRSLSQHSGKYTTDEYGNGVPGTLAHHAELSPWSRARQRVAIVTLLLRPFRLPGAVALQDGKRSNSGSQIIRHTP